MKVLRASIIVIVISVFVLTSCNPKDYEEVVKSVEIEHVEDEKRVFDGFTSSNSNTTEEDDHPTKENATSNSNSNTTEEDDHPSKEN